MDLERRVEPRSQQSRSVKLVSPQIRGATGEYPVAPVIISPDVLRELFLRRYFGLLRPPRIVPRCAVGVGLLVLFALRTEAICSACRGEASILDRSARPPRTRASARTYLT